MRKCCIKYFSYLLEKVRVVFVVVWRQTPQDGGFASIDLVKLIVSKSYEKEMCGVMLSVCVEAACIT